MASTRDIRRRIRGVKNIQQVTRAMNMIAAARLRRAQSRAESARPYAERLLKILRDITSSGVVLRHPLLEKRDVNRIGVLLVTSDRGLCGAFNANVIREAAHFIEKQTVPCIVTTVGRKGAEYFRRREFEMAHTFPQPSREMKLEEVGAITKSVIADYSEGKCDQLFLCFTHFINVVRYQPELMQLLPLEPEAPQANKAREPGQRNSYQFEPPAEEILNQLLPRYVEVLVYRALVDSFASEQASRMVAMKNATDSAADMIGTLTMKYNRLRQEKITKELLEVVSGAEALAHAHEG
jgi:F-type H+-transporting ATPase subunit gamma